MRLGVMADVHGNDVALRAVLDDAAARHVDRWWILGDLVLSGPRPAEVLDLLRSLPGVEMLAGNTDRYVLTGEQPAPHATAADAARRIDLVERYGLMAAGIGWTRGVLSQAGLLENLTALPRRLRLGLPDGTRVLGVHASPEADSGPGIEPGISDDDLGRLLAGSAADVVIGGHTHRATDRHVNGIRVLNPGSTGIPLRPGEAGWLLLEFADGPESRDNPGHGTVAGPRAEQRMVAFDVDAVVRDLHARLHPNTEFLEAILTGSRPQRQESDDSADGVFREAAGNRLTALAAGQRARERDESRTAATASISTSWSR
jgi:predicted phosphodiesterase